MPFGVDFGTTNSSIAWADQAGQIHSLSVRSGKEPFDAVVRSVVLDPLGTPVVGHQAFEAAVSSAGAPLLSSFKFKLDKQRLRQTIVQTEHVATREYDPVRQGAMFEERRIEQHLYDEHSRKQVVGATAHVLRRLLMSDEISKDAAIQVVGGPRGVLSRLVHSLARTETDPSTVGSFDQHEDEWLYVGIPVTVGPTARKRMLSALAHTDLFGKPPSAYRNVLRRCRFVYEPLAIASTLQLVDSQSVLIFDYGGGSLDLALLDVQFDAAGMSVQERALGGVASAGDFLDECFREALLAQDAELRRAYKRELGSGSTFDRWRAGSYFTFAKIELSRAASTTLRLPGFSRKVTRAQFTRAIAPSLSEVMDAVDDCLKRGDLDPGGVGQVVLTGGSSLIPAVQDRLRDRFAHLDDTSFIAGVGGDAVSEREALTGVSRGLANYGFVSQFFEATTPCDYGLWSEGGLFPCLKRGEPAVYELEEAPVQRVPVAGSSSVSFALYSNLVRDAFCGAVADVKIPARSDAVDIRVAASRRRFVPAFAVYAAGTRKELRKFDLEGLPATKLQAFIEGDSEWLPDSDHLVSAFLTRPLQMGDFVEWQTNGRHRRGQVIGIRDVHENLKVDHMRDVDPVAYRVDVAIEERSNVIRLDRRAQCDWMIGDVRLV